ncbi:hypothetical protein [Streptomyces sp. KL116D]|uniref:hypothetical protein n=1 Tax=Streptomyces sp. KL116D TaxID=3045152 RepID=UPI00355636F6
MTHTVIACHPADLIFNARARLFITARDMWINGNPDLAARMEHGQTQFADPDLDVMHAGLEEISNVLHEAVQAVGGFQ